MKVLQIIVIVGTVTLVFLVTFAFSSILGTAILTAASAALVVAERASRLFRKRPLERSLVEPLWSWLQKNRWKTALISVVVIVANFGIAAFIALRPTLLVNRVESEVRRRIAVTRYEHTPVPVHWNGRTKYRLDVSDVDLTARGDVVFVLGPGGVGKTPIRKGLIADATTRAPRTWNVISVELRNIAEGFRQSRVVGSSPNAGLPQVLSLLAPTPSNQSLTGWLASHISKWEELREAPWWVCGDDALHSAVDDWIRRCATGPKGLIIVIDDLDEVGDNTLEALLSAIRRDCERIVTSDEYRITFVLIGRTEAVRSGWARIREIQDLEGESHGAILIKDFRIGPLDVENTEQMKLRIRRQVEFDLGGNEPGDEAVRESVKRRWTDLLYGLNKSKAAAEASRYLFGATTVMYYLKDHTDFDEEEFVVEMYEKLWDRENAKRQLPPSGYADRKAFEKEVLSALEYIASQGGEASNLERVRVLLLSGLCELVPAKNALSGGFKAREQYPFIRRYLQKKLREQEPVGD